MPTIDEITIADEPDTWRALGFDVSDDGCQIGGVMIRFAGAGAGAGADAGAGAGAGADRGSREGRPEREAAGILGWSLRDLPSAELDGLPTTSSDAPARPPAMRHPNGVLEIDHVVAISPSFERSVEAFQAVGLDLRRVREEPTPAGAPRQAFFRLGREILELVQEPEEIAQRKGGPERPVRFWGLALLSDDLDRTVEAMAPHAEPPRAAVQPGRRISTVGRSAGLAIPVALMTREQDR
jgi:hypothetical protein